MQLKLLLLNKTEKVVDINDVIFMQSCTDNDPEYPGKYISVIEVLLSNKELAYCRYIHFGYDEAIVGKSVNETRKIRKNKAEKADRSNL